MLKKFPLYKISDTKNAFFFLSQTPTNYSFTFNSWFLRKLKHKVSLSKCVSGIIHFRFRLVFIKAYYWHVSKISLKISFILLFDINSPTLSFQNLLHTSVEIHSLLVTRCKITQYSLRNSLVTCCRSCLLQKITRYSLQKLFLVKNHSLLVAKFDR